AVSKPYQDLCTYTYRSEIFWRSRFKPHGYAGDFRLLEMFYDLQDNAAPDAGVSVAQNLLSFICTELQCVRLIHARALRFEALLLDAMERKRSLRILDVGAGGMRYFRRAHARSGYRDDIVVDAYDQDATLSQFQACEIDPRTSGRVNLVCAPIKAILSH